MCQSQWLQVCSQSNLRVLRFLQSWSNWSLISTTRSQAQSNINFKLQPAWLKSGRNKHFACSTAKTHIQHFTIFKRSQNKFWVCTVQGKIWRKYTFLVYICTEHLLFTCTVAGTFCNSKFINVIPWKRC